MIYVALGDSITFGYDAAEDRKRYVTELTRMLARQTRTCAYIHAKPGWTTSQLARSLDRIPACILAEAGLITIMIGGNDLIQTVPWFLDDVTEAVEKLRARVHPQLVGLVRRVRKSSRARILLCTVYNPFPASGLAQRGVEELNALIRAVAVVEGCGVVPVDRYFSGREAEWVHGYQSGELNDFRLRKNPIHPNDHGHAQIARAIFEAYRALRRVRRQTATRDGAARRRRMQGQPKGGRPKLSPASQGTRKGV